MELLINFLEIVGLLVVFLIIVGFAARITAKTRNRATRKKRGAGGEAASKYAEGAPGGDDANESGDPARN